MKIKQIHKETTEPLDEFKSIIRDINQFGIKAKGRKELLAYLNGQEISKKAAILAKCYDCCGGYCDGRHDCVIPSCSLYPYMPYRKEKSKTKRVKSEKQMEAFKKMTVISSGTRRNTSGREGL